MAVLAFNNSTEITQNFSATLNSTNEPPTTSGAPVIPTVPIGIIATVGLVICSVAVIANSVVLAVLVRARREFGSTAHTLIANQSAMDLSAAVFAMSTMIMFFAHGYRYGGNKVVDGAICVLFEGGTPTITAMTAAIIGLVITTVERYFKIVHAIAHRKYYRNWMTKVGVALPWIGGAALILFPAMGTTRIVNGQCVKTSVWPNEAMAKVSWYTLFSCTLYYLQPAVELLTIYPARSVCLHRPMCVCLCNHFS